MKRSEINILIGTHVEKIVSFIREYLYPRKDVNHSVLDRYNSILLEYQKSKNLDGLIKFRDVYYRPSREGANTDFTEGTSVNVEGDYKSLMSLFDELEDLIDKYNNAG